MFQKRFLLLSILKTVVLLNIFVQMISDIFFSRTTKLKYCVTFVIIVTSDKLNASLLN